MAASTDAGRPRPAAQPLVSLLVVNYRRPDLLNRCLQHLAAQSFGRFEALVVDNASTPASRQAIMLPDDRFRLLSPAVNLGFAAANNLAARQARGQWLATINPDAFARTDWLQNLLAAAQRHPAAAMIGSTMLRAADTKLLDGTGDIYFAWGLAWRGEHGRVLKSLPKEGEVFGPSAAAALYRKDVFLASGGFDESFFCYYEDVDLAFRLRLKGQVAMQAPEAVVEHLGGGVAGERSAFARYHGARNRLWTFIKDMPGPLLLLLLPGHILMQLFLLGKTALRGGLKPTARGLRDALIGLGPQLAARRRVQGQRTASLGSLARAFCWSPLRALGRRHCTPRVAEPAAARDLDFHEEQP